MNKHTIQIFFSDEDEGFIAVAPELPGCSAFGKTKEEALKEIKTAMDLWKDIAKKESRKLEDLHDLAIIAERRDEPNISFQELKKRLEDDGIL